MLPKIRIIQKKSSNKSFSASNFGQKSTPGHVFISPRVKLGGSKDDMDEILNYTETENEKKLPNNFYLKLSLE